MRLLPFNHTHRPAQTRSKYIISRKLQNRVNDNNKQNFELSNVARALELPCLYHPLHFSLTRCLYAVHPDPHVRQRCSLLQGCRPSKPSKVQSSDRCHLYVCMCTWLTRKLWQTQQSICSTPVILGYLYYPTILRLSNQQPNTNVAQKYLHVPSRTHTTKHAPTHMRYINYGNIKLEPVRGGMSLELGSEHPKAGPLKPKTLATVRGTIGQARSITSPAQALGLHTERRG